MKIEIVSPFSVFVTLDSEQLERHFVEELVAVTNKCVLGTLIWANTKILQILFGPDKGSIRLLNGSNGRMVELEVPAYDQDYLWTLLKDVQPVVKAHQLALEALQTEFMQ